MSDAATLKAEANKAFAAKDYPKATDLYSQAIELDSENHVLYSNRSASKTGQKDYTGALEDADKCISLNSQFSKGYVRKGAALHGLRQYPEAVMAYESGLAIEPNSDPLKKGLAEVEKAMKSDTESDSPFAPGGDMGLGKMFSDPGLIRKLENNPKTRECMKDPSFVGKIRLLQASGGKGVDVQSMFADPRFLSVLGVAMGMDIDAMERPEGSSDVPDGFERLPSSEASSSKPASTPAAKPTPPAAAPKEEVKSEAMEVDTPENAGAQKEAEALKVKGNAAYKARRFEEAVEAYTKAWELYPKDVAFLTNLSAVYFEQADYTKCIETCEKAVEEARELRADYKVYAKAYGRIGSAYAKLDDLDSAIKFYSKSLTESRTPDILNKLRETEKLKAERDKQAYIDPEKAEAAREEGNVSFKGGDYASAVKQYTEAIKRLPNDPRAYNNRAAAYTKLMAMPEALKDAEQAIKIDPTFIKAYIRKALTQQTMKELTSALNTLQTAADVDKEKKHTREIETHMSSIMRDLDSQRAGETDAQTYERAVRDPEIAEILNDPVMRHLLQESQEDPRALRDHMKNPMIAGKIQKLINAGIIKTR